MVSRTFRSLRHRDYRWWAAGALVSNTGTWMQRIAQDWLAVQVLPGASGTAGGVTTALQFAPVLLLAPLAGGLADRFSRRRLLVVTQVVTALLATATGVLVVTEHAALWHLYVLALLLGCVTALDGPARLTFAGQLVPEEDLPNAVALNAASFNAARLIGPAVAGLLIASIGAGPVFLLNALSFVPALAALRAVRHVDRADGADGTGGAAGAGGAGGAAGAAGAEGRAGRPARAPASSRGVRAGLRHVRERPELVVVLALVAVVGGLGLNFQLTSALVVGERFGLGAAEFGLAGTAVAVGSLGGALVAARREGPRHRVLVGAAAAFGALASLSALVPTYELYLLVLVPMGVASLTFFTTANATVQTRSDPAVRGRVVALYLALLQGGAVLGAPLVGWVGTRAGAQWAVLTGSLPATAAALAAAVALLLLRRRAATAARPRPPAPPPASPSTPPRTPPGPAAPRRPGAGAAPPARR
ncbi:MFS transporter [Kineococcus gypseus]|uniref:MFS transporter n=1 Tax=Kineococcus gypseus TaxID=1637102 RepID=UPI003D7EE163